MGSLSDLFAFDEVILRFNHDLLLVGARSREGYCLSCRQPLLRYSILVPVEWRFLELQEPCASTVSVELDLSLSERLHYTAAITYHRTARDTAMTQVTHSVPICQPLAESPLIITVAPNGAYKCQRSPSAAADRSSAGSRSQGLPGRRGSHDAYACARPRRQAFAGCADLP